MGLTWTLTTFTLLADLQWYKHDSITLGKIGWQKLNNGGRSCSFNKKEIVDWTFCLAVSVYDVLLLVEERLKSLYHEVIANVIDLASLTLPCSMRWSKPILNKEQSREPLAKVHLWAWNIKAKPFILHLCFKISFTSFINILFKKKEYILFTNKHSSPRSKPQTLTLIPLDLFWKREPILMMQLAISWGVTIMILLVLLVLHRITTFFTDDGKGKLMVHHRTSSTWSLWMSMFNLFIGAKYSFHTLAHLLRPATAEYPGKRV